MILATFRSEEVGRDHPLTVVMGDLATLPGVVRMQLPALTAAGVRQLLTEAGSALDADTVGHHVSAVLRKLQAPNRSRAVATALRLGIIPPR